MDIMQMAVQVWRSDLRLKITAMETYFGYPNDREWSQSAVVWLKNGYGVSITKGDNPMQVHVNPMTSDTAELMVVRRINGGHGSVSDYNNPVTSNVIRSATVGEIVEALQKLSTLVNDPDDLTERPAP